MRVVVRTIVNTKINCCDRLRGVQLQQQRTFSGSRFLHSFNWNIGSTEFSEPVTCDPRVTRSVKSKPGPLLGFFLQLQGLCVANRRFF